MINDADTLTYIIKCDNGDFYCGKTKDIDKRMKTHLKEKLPHYFAFKGRKPFFICLIFSGDFEKQIKRAGIKLIYNLFYNEFHYTMSHGKYENKEVSAS